MLVRPKTLLRLQVDNNHGTYSGRVRVSDWSEANQTYLPYYRYTYQARGNANNALADAYQLAIKIADESGLDHHLISWP